MTTGIELRGKAERSLPPADDLGAEALALAALLFPLPRSMTGDGVRDTLRLISEIAPLEIVEVPTGTPVLDWSVPPEWAVREAWIADTDGNRLVDLADSRLHVIGYSDPVRARMTGAELEPHLHSIPGHPDWIPARTSYWERRWGICLADRVRATIDPDALFDVVIDSTLADGSLTYGEAVLPGATDDEILVSTYTCHPALANDGVSGLVVAALLARSLAGIGLRHTLRFVFAPATIGAITWLARNEGRLRHVRAGLVVSCLGDEGSLTVKRSRCGTSAIDRAATLVVEERGGTVRDFVPWGGDERHFCSPGFDLPVVSLTRTPHGEYPEYHTSADDLSLLGAGALADAIAACAAIIDVVDRDLRPVGCYQRGEPRLGERGLYTTLGAGVPGGEQEYLRALLWVLNQADGARSLIDIAERSGLPFGLIAAATGVLAERGLIQQEGSP